MIRQRPPYHFSPCSILPLRKEKSPIAIYHLSIKIISRGKGRSAVAAAAYRAAEKIQNQYDGEIHDYTKKGSVVHSEILLPDHAPAEYKNRSTLWNAVEKVERYKTAQLAREIEIALPVELTAEQNISLVRDYVNQHFVSVGMCADVAIHDTGGGNPHAHIMLAMRPIENGEWGAKSRTIDGVKIPTVDWNEQTKAEVWREAWEIAVNRELERHNHEARIDHRSYERQGIDQIPTIHLGAAAHQMEQRGIATERGNINREIRALNRQLRKLKSQMSKAQKDISKLAKKPEAPTVIDEGKPFTMQDAERQIKDMMNEQSELRERLKPIEGRLKVLNELLKQVAIHKENKPFLDEYKALPPRKQKKYFAEHKTELELFKSANSYLSKHRNAEGKIPLAAWVRERDGLLKEKKEISKSTMSLMERLRQSDRIRKMARETMPIQPQRNRGWEMEH